MKKRILINILLLIPVSFLAISLARATPATDTSLLFGTLILAVIGTAFSWMAWHLTYQPYGKQENEQTHTEKRKRETLDNVLRDLSDEQLDTLRQRLSDGTIDDDVIERRVVGADGELIQQR